MIGRPDDEALLGRFAEWLREARAESDGLASGAGDGDGNGNGNGRGRGRGRWQPVEFFADSLPVAGYGNSVTVLE